MRNDIPDLNKNPHNSMDCADYFVSLPAKKRNCNEEEYYCYDDGVADGGM